MATTTAGYTIEADSGVNTLGMPIVIYRIVKDGLTVAETRDESTAELIRKALDASGKEST